MSDGRVPLMVTTIKKCCGDPVRIAGHRGFPAAADHWSVSQGLRTGVPPRARSTS